MRKIPKYSFLLLITLLSISFAAEIANNGFINHLVKKGESVSLICIDYYGYYSKELGMAFQKDNPQIKDINIIIPGQALRFRSPRPAGAKPAVPPAAAAADDSLFVKKIAARQGVVTCVEGTATLIRKGLSTGENLFVNTIVGPGDRIKTSANGRVEIIINRETVVRLREKTTAVIEIYRNPGNTRGKTKIGFSAGTIWTKMKKFQDKISRFELELPNAVAGVHGTVYQAEVNADSSAEVKVFSGEVSVKGKSGEPAARRAGRGKGVKEVAGPSEVAGPTEVDLETWVRIVKSMQKVVIDKFGNASASRPFSWDTTNTWEAWNRERDTRIQEMFEGESTVTIPKAIALAAGTVFLAALAFLQPLRFINNLFYDLSFRFSSTPAADSVAIVAIDDASIDKIGAMPWSRGTLAKLIDSINTAGAGAITLDILFPRRPDSLQNDSLRAAFARVPKLVLPFKIGHLTEGKGPAAVPSGKDVFYKFRFLRLVNQDQLANTTFYSGADITTSDSQFTQFARYGGFLNVSTNASSQKLREVVHVIRVGNEYYPSLGIASVAAWRNLGPGETVLDGKGLVALGPLKCPITSYAATAFINYRRSGFCTVSAADLLNGTADRSRLRGKLVFVGVTDPAAGADFFLSPISPQYPGVMVWATVALDIIQSAWVCHGGGMGDLGNNLLLLLLFPGCALIIPSYRRLLSIGAGTGIVAASVIISILIFKTHHYFWDPTGHFYGWIMMLLWLAASKAVPSLGSLPPLALEPVEFIDETVPLPPKELDFKERLPQTATVQFVSKTHNQGGETGQISWESPATTLSTTMLKTSTESGPEAALATPAIADLDEKAREIAGGVILRCLGSGGMADVYLVWNPRLEVYRAVKIMKPGQSESVLSRFETEIRIFAKLHHANIVECYGVGDWHTLPYIEMEYINGLSMDDVLRQCDRLTLEQSLSIGVLVCRALHYAHNQTIYVSGSKYKGIVHRDLKPANIMLCRNGRVKLTDFGIARPGELALNTSNTGQIIGTFPYLAPEQIDGSDLTGQADVYALGATIYEFITGDRAFPQSDANAILSAKITGTYKPITPSGAVTKEIIAVIDRAMATNPADRYGSAAALRTDLERVLRPLLKLDGYSHIQALADRTMKKIRPDEAGKTA